MLQISQHVPHPLRRRRNESSYIKMSHLWNVSFVLLSETGVWCLVFGARPASTRHQTLDTSRRTVAYTAPMLKRTLSILQRVMEIILLFALVRVIVGVTMIALFNRDAVAWGIELTLIIALAFAVSILVALAVRRWSPPRRA